MQRMHGRTVKIDLNEPDYYDGVMSHPESNFGLKSQIGLKKLCC